MIAEFAQLVGLLAAFHSGRQSKEHAELHEFLVWLSEHNHQQLRRLLEQNQETAVSIKSLLNLRLEDIGAKLDDISKQLAEIVHRTEGVESLAAGFSESLVSDQAYEILRHMEESGSGYFLIGKSSTGPTSLIVGGGPTYQVREPRFLEDDLGMLVTLGLLLMEHTRGGKPRYRYTRAASRLFRK